MFITLTEIYRHYISTSPSHPLFSMLRYQFYKKRLKSAKKFFSCTGFTVVTPENISIGESCFFNVNVYLGAVPGNDSEIIIGDDCIFAPNVVIVASEHCHKDISQLMRTNPAIGGKIIIGDGCWIGANATITKDVTIGHESVIGANSVVTNNIPAYSVAAGCPARIIGVRK
jgi:maltose O-acetyltransferase